MNELLESRGTLVRRPEAVERLDRTAEHAATPCGEGQLAWRIWGAGAPLLLLHGGFGSWQHWVRNVKALSARHRVLAVDLPGLGDSATAPPPHTAEALAAIIGDGLDVLVPGDEPVAILGFSLGGVISVPLAQALGARLRRLILIGPSGIGRHWRNATTALRRRTPDMTLLQVREVVAHNLGVSMISDPAHIDDLAIDIQTALLGQQRGLRGLPISESDILLVGLPRIAAPVTIIWGEADPYLVPDVRGCVEALRREFPALDVRILGGIGHWANYEASEAVNAIILELLEQDETNGRQRTSTGQA